MLNRTIQKKHNTKHTTHLLTPSALCLAAPSALAPFRAPAGSCLLLLPRARTSSARAPAAAKRKASWVNGSESSWAKLLGAGEGAATRRGGRGFSGGDNSKWMSTGPSDLSGC